MKAERLVDCLGLISGLGGGRALHKPEDFGFHGVQAQLGVFNVRLEAFDDLQLLLEFSNLPILLQDRPDLDEKQFGFDGRD